jgi:hypothetical protein
MSSRSAWRGDRRIRVGLEVDESSARPVSAWVLDGPAVQRPSLGGSHVVRVEVSGRLELLQSVDNPRLMRSIPGPGRVGHHFGMKDQARIYVDVPVRNDEPLRDVSISITDLSDLGDRPTSPTAMEQMLDVDKPRGMRSLSTVTLDDLRALPDWEAVAHELEQPGG